MVDGRRTVNPVRKKHSRFESCHSHYKSNFMELNIYHKRKATRARLQALIWIPCQNLMIKAFLNSVENVSSVAYTARLMEALSTGFHQITFYGAVVQWLGCLTVYQEIVGSNPISTAAFLIMAASHAKNRLSHNISEEL